jgi:hypothetical protein
MSDNRPQFRQSYGSEIICGCWRRDCRHKVEMRVHRARFDRAVELFKSLTDSDHEWLDSVGWDGQFN